MPDAELSSPELKRLAEDAARKANWKRWGPYLAERQWSTVREDYSANGDSWNYFPHDQARSRAYRWGEDGLLGITDRECRLCFALGLWNGRDPFLKERLFGLTNPQGNHGEDVKECYYYIDSTPTHSWMEAMYRYPQARFPYEQLVAENARRGRQQPEFELADTGVLADGRYFDVRIQYAKAAPDDILIAITAFNRGSAAAPLHVLPTLWFRNTWSWGCHHEGCWIKPRIALDNDGRLTADHATLERFRFAADAASDGTAYQWLFTDNVTDNRRLYNVENLEPFTKDAFHRLVVEGEAAAVNPRNIGTKVAPWYSLNIPPGGQVTVRLRLYAASEATQGPVFGSAFSDILSAQGRGRPVLRGAAAQRERRRLPDRPIRILRPVVEQTVLRLRSRGLAGRRSGNVAAARTAQVGPQRRLAALVLPRRALHAGQMGVSLVCGLGSGVSHGCLVTLGPGLRPRPVGTDAPRMVHASQRGASRLRVGLWGRQSAGPCLGLLGGLQGHEHVGDAAVGVSFLRVPKAADEFHLVGEPQGLARQPPFLRRVFGAGQYRRVRPLAAAARRRTTGAGRRHGMDGLLLRNDAGDGPGAGVVRSGHGRHGLQVLRTLRPHCRRDQQSGRHGPVERGGRLLLRPDAGRRTERAAAIAVDGGAGPAFGSKPVAGVHDQQLARLS